MWVRSILIRSSRQGYPGDLPASGPRPCAFGGLDPVFFGPDFPAGNAALVILIAGHLVNALAGSVGFLMPMTGHEREAAYIIGVSVTVKLALNAAPIPPYGIEGAATATAFTTVLWNISMFVFVNQRLGINSTAFRLPW